MTEEEQDTEKADVVCDTSLLLNFVRVERLDLLADHPAYRFHLPAEVREEVIRPQQAADLRRWLVEGGLREIALRPAQSWNSSRNSMPFWTGAKLHPSRPRFQRVGSWPWTRAAGLGGRSRTGSAKGGS